MGLLAKAAFISEELLLLVLHETYRSMHRHLLPPEYFSRAKMAKLRNPEALTSGNLGNSPTAAGHFEVLTIFYCGRVFHNSVPQLRLQRMK